MNGKGVLESKQKLDFHYTRYFMTFSITLVYDNQVCSLP